MEGLFAQSALQFLWFSKQAGHGETVWMDQDTEPFG